MGNIVTKKAQKRIDGEDIDVQQQREKHEKKAVRHSTQRRKAVRKNSTPPSFLDVKTELPKRRGEKHSKAQHSRAVDNKAATELRQTVGSLGQFCLAPTLWYEVPMRYS